MFINCQVNPYRMYTSIFKTIFLVFISCLILFPHKIYASHVTGAELTYTHISGTTYKITLTLYGDCSSFSGAFQTLPASTPPICIYDGSTYIMTDTLSLPSPACGTEITPMCTGSISTCTSTTALIRGITKFVYSGNVTLPYTSTVWRFVYSGNNGNTAHSYSCSGILGSGTAYPLSSGRTAAITNITAGSSIQLIDTLNNSTAPNNSVVFLNNPPTYFINDSVDYFYPNAVDPDGDSLHFALVDAGNGSASCGTIGGYVSYIFPFTGSTPLHAIYPTVFNSSNGLFTFKPISLQRSVVVYNVEEYRSGVLAGTTQHEMTYLVQTGDTSSSSTPCFGSPLAGEVSVATGCSTAPDTLKISNGFPGCGLAFQWQSSTDDITWTNISGATTSAYPFTPTTNLFYRCQVTCSYSGLASFSYPVYVPLSGWGILHIAVTTPVDTFCNGPVIYLSACGSSSAYNVATFYGDGTSDTTALTPTPLCHATISHAYTAPGSYYIYEVLYNSSTPVDTTGFTYEYTYCRNLPVKFYYDANTDCVFDEGDSYCYLPVLTEVDSNGSPIDTVSASGGFYYKALGGAGTVYSFKVISAPAGFYASCPASGILYDTISSTVTDYSSLYFAFNCTSSTSFDLAEYATFRAGPHSGGATMVVNNNYCTPETAVYTMTYSPKYAFVSAFPPPASVAGNVITWNLDSVSAWRPPYVLNISFWKAGAPDLTIGDTVHSDYLVTPTTGDAVPANNSSSRIDTVQASYDPNYLAGNPAGIIYPGTQLQYTIGFENTGNATAHDIYIMDTITDYIDMGSLKVITSSAAMQVAPYIAGGNTVVKFDFPHINLPDSSHHNQNTGMVVFTVNTKTGLPGGTTIFSHAGIYFDDNAPVVTDTVEDIICTGMCGPDLTGVLHNNAIELFPNPAKNQLTIKMDQGAYSSLYVTNTVGQVIIAESVSNSVTRLNIASLPAVIYYVTFKVDNGTRVMKFVKM